MAKNICPRCKQVTLTVDSQTEIDCPVCDTVFELSDGLEDSTNTDAEKEG